MISDTAHKLLKLRYCHNILLDTTEGLTDIQETHVKNFPSSTYPCPIEDFNRNIENPDLQSQRNSIYPR